MFVTERLISIYSGLLSSPEEDIRHFAMKWILESKVTLDLLEKYNVRMLVEQQYYITHELARHLLKKIGDLEEELENGAGFYTLTPSPVKRRRSRSTGKFVGGIEIMEGPARNLQKQLDQHCNKKQ
ncbi:Protein CBG14001 [Caenorhabditis briggsae]|uniref:Protein CBG14001 n=1 Tax=Caenorhabditis briggsae TaxID=6238 RepID=A8XJ66_CAEBR|nr:Protein CBG14001 [Caenorhabditis briggsae]CAP32691.1 Protein CBG14001 [Caenorhabditis briggsae]